jgi:hypothetical protein
MAVGARGDGGDAAEVMAQIGRGAEAAAPGDGLHRFVGGLQQLLRQPHPFLEQPLEGRGAEGLAEPPGEGAFAEVGLAGQAGRSGGTGRRMTFAAKPLDERTQQ